MLEENRPIASEQPASIPDGFGASLYSELKQASGDDKPKILLMGLRRSGKSSIQQVVFHKLPPNDTAFLESTQQIEKCDVPNCSFIRFEIWDCPGHVEFNDDRFLTEAMFPGSCAIIFVIDAQDDCSDALRLLQTTLSKAIQCNANIKFEVFVHKVDGLTDDCRIDIQRELSHSVSSTMDDLLSVYVNSTGISVGFHLTTIYDHSIFEAFSKVVQKLIPCLDVFEDLLNCFILNSMVEKAFLFDISTKIYLATDCSSVDMRTYELCCDMIDVVVDVSSIYSSDPTAPGDVAPFSDQAATTIVLNTECVLYLRGINRYMGLACLMQEEYLEKMSLIDYNFEIIKEGLQKMIDVNQQHAREECASVKAAAASALTASKKLHSNESNGPSQPDSANPSSNKIGTGNANEATSGATEMTSKPIVLGNPFVDVPSVR